MVGNAHRVGRLLIVVEIHLLTYARDVIRELNAQSAACNVELMDTIVRDVAAAIMPMPVNGTVKPVSVEGKLGNRAGPSLVIDTGRHGFVILVADIIPELHIPHLGHQHAAE